MQQLLDLVEGRGVGGHGLADGGEMVHQQLLVLVDEAPVHRMVEVAPGDGQGQERDGGDGEEKAGAERHAASGAHGRNSRVTPKPRMVWINLVSPTPSSFFLRRPMATSTALESVEKFMSHTCSASVVRDSTCPLRRAR